MYHRHEWTSIDADANIRQHPSSALVSFRGALSPHASDCIDGRAFWIAFALTMIGDANRSGRNHRFCHYSSARSICIDDRSMRSDCENRTGESSKILRAYRFILRPMSVLHCRRRGSCAAAGPVDSTRSGRCGQGCAEPFWRHRQRLAATPDRHRGTRHHHRSRREATSPACAEDGCRRPDFTGSSMAKAVGLSDPHKWAGSPADPRASCGFPRRAGTSVRPTGPSSAPATLLPRRPSATAGSEAPAPGRGFVFARIAMHTMRRRSCRTPFARIASSPEGARMRTAAIVHRAGPRAVRSAVCTFIFPSSIRIGNGLATAGDKRRRAHHSPTAKKTPP